MKTFDKKDVFSWANCEDAKQYIGQKGYMANSNVGLQETINIHRVYELKDIDEDNVLCFYRPQCDYGRGLFLPSDKVKEVEEPKKWRPFKDIGEFQNITNKFIGDILEIKMPSWSDEPFRALILWATQNNLGIASVTRSSFNDLFQILELKNYKNEWQPFGVLDES